MLLEVKRYWILPAARLPYCGQVLRAGSIQYHVLSFWNHVFLQKLDTNVKIFAYIDNYTVNDHYQEKKH